MRAGVQDFRRCQLALPFPRTDPPTWLGGAAYNKRRRLTRWGWGVDLGWGYRRRAALQVPNVANPPDTPPPPIPTHPPPTQQKSNAAFEKRRCFSQPGVKGVNTA
jgi:hypothetical protein